MPAWIAGIQVCKDASGNIHVNLDSGTPCWNDATRISETFVLFVVKNFVSVRRMVANKFTQTVNQGGFHEHPIHQSSYG